MNRMFSGCSSLTVLDLSSMDIFVPNDTMYMFEGCDNLTTIHTPKCTGSTVVKLPENSVWKDSNGKIYEAFPENANESIILKRNY